MVTKNKKSGSGKKVEVAKMFMTGGGKLFSEADLKRYELPASRSKQVKKEVSFGLEVIEPPHSLGGLMNWLHQSVIHSACVYTKVQDSVGIGWKLVEVEGVKAVKSDYDLLYQFFNKVNDKEDITSVCKKVGTDYEGCGNGYFEIVRGVNAEAAKEVIKHIYHISASSIRLCKDKERFIQRIGSNKVYFKQYGDTRDLDKDTGIFENKIDPDKAANEIIQIKQYTHKSTYYGLPDWLPALYQMYGEMKEKEYNLDFFANYGIPAYAVILEGMTFGTEAKQEIAKYFETEVKNNPHKTMVFTLKKGATMTFEKLSTETKEASFRVFRKDNRDDVLTAHRVPPYRASIVEKGALGGAVAEDVDRIYLDSVINPRQKDFAWILNELIIKGGFEIAGYVFEFEDIDIRDRKTQAEIDKAYFQMGARTPNEILIAQGKDTYEGGDIYYIPSTMVPVGGDIADEEEPEIKEDEDDDESDGSDESEEGSED